MILLATLPGCSGDDPEESYCEAVRDERRRLTELAEQAGEQDTDVVSGTLASLRELQEAAPAELDDEYSTVVYAWEALADAVEEAGIDPADFDRAETLRELDPPVARRIRQTAGALGGQRVVDATTGIEDHALQVCEVDLGQ